MYPLHPLLGPPTPRQHILTMIFNDVRATNTKNPDGHIGRRRRRFNCYAARFNEYTTLTYYHICWERVFGVLPATAPLSSSTYFNVNAD